MSLDEAKTLQSQILFGSSECSCSSCESVLCFAKRNRELNKCNCPACQELNTCLYITKNKDSNCYRNVTDTVTENPPSPVTKDSSITKFKATTRAKIENKNIVSIRLFKRNVILQAKPQCCEKIKYKSKSEPNTNENNETREYSPITYIVNKVLTTYNDISLKDILEKIKRVYRACSCKVCDCVANDASVCKCKPCECIECKSYLKDNEEKSSNVYNYQVRETCSGNRKVDNEPLKLQDSSCSCKPCDCELCRLYTIKVKDSLQSFVIKNPEAKEATSLKTKSTKSVENKRSETCSCKPCQCIICASPFHLLNKVVVGSMAEHLQSAECSCVPCDCVDCRSAVPSTSPHPMRETSTEMTETTACRCDLCFSHSCRQKRDTCGCESRNSVINKPFEKDTKDIDIHRAQITKKSKSDELEQTCTISVLTKIIKDYKEKEARKAKKSKSEDTNRCLKCNSKMKCTSSLCEKSHLSTHRVKKTEVNKCQCSPCECEICEKLKSVDNGVWKSVKFRSKCYCDMCRCIYCGGLLKPQHTADDDDRDKPQTSHCGKKSDNSSTFTSHQSIYPALLYEYINPRPVNENVPMYNSNRFRSDNLFKYTCDDCIRMVNGDKNEIAQVNSELSDIFCSCDALSSCQDSSHILRSSEKLNFFESKQTIPDSRVVNNFVNEIMQIDGVKSNLEQDNQKELSNSSDSTSWGFQEVAQNKSQQSLKKNVSGCNENPFQKQETEDNEPCVFCGTFTLNSFTANTGNKEGIQIIRECFAKTNLAVINSLDVNKKDIENTTFEDSDNDNLDENSEISKGGECNEFEYQDDYFEERSILFKAKLLTSELLKMLYEFQKANKDFDTFKNKSNICHDTNLEEYRNNLQSFQLGNMTRQDLLQVLSLESKFDMKCDTKIEQNTTSLEAFKENNVACTNFKYSWTKTALVNKRKTKIFPCYSKTDLTNNYGNILNEDMYYNDPIYAEKMAELDLIKINNDILSENINYLTRAEELPKFKESTIFKKDFSKDNNIQDGNVTLNMSKYLNFDSMNYGDIMSSNKNRICDDNRHILIENIFQNAK